MLEIYVNIDARTLKFELSPPYQKSLWFSKNQLEGSSEDYVWAIKEPSFGNQKDKMGLQDKNPAPEGFH